MVTVTVNGAVDSEQYKGRVTLDSGRGKRRLKDFKGAGILEGLLQEMKMLGSSTAVLGNNRLR